MVHSNEAVGDQPDYPELQDLAISLLAEEPGLGIATAAGGADDVGFGGGAVSLDLADLLSDNGGELVLDIDVPVALQAHLEVADSGIAGSHVTENGDDVSGFSYVAFADGPTLFYPSDLDVTVHSGEVV